MHNAPDDIALDLDLALLFRIFADAQVRADADRAEADLLGHKDEDEP